jgi:hypothetical protein
MQTKNDADILDNPSIKGIARRTLTWYDGGKYAFIPLERDIIDQLRLTRDDLFSQEITAEGGILLRRFKGTT